MKTRTPLVLVATSLLTLNSAFAVETNLTKEAGEKTFPYEISVLAGAGLSVSTLKDSEDDGDSSTSYAAPVYGAMVQGKGPQTPIGQVLVGAGARGTTASENVGTFKSDDKSITLNSMQLDLEAGLAQQFAGFEFQETIGYSRGLWHDSSVSSGKVAANKDEEWKSRDIENDNALGLSVRAMKSFDALSTGIELGAQTRRFDVDSDRTEDVLTSSTRILVGYNF